MRDYFYELSDHLSKSLKAGEEFLAYLRAEESDFCRLNGAKVRQAGAVSQASLALTLIKGKRHVEHSFELCGRSDEDRGRLTRALAKAREALEAVPEDPYLLYATEVVNSDYEGENRLPDARETIEKITAVAGDLDLVGIWASGSIYRGFANSFGQRNWFGTHSFNFDWSFYLKADKAVKDGYAGFVWDDQAFEAKVERARKELEVLASSPKTIAPGKYRVYLSPAALTEVCDMLGWGGFSKKALETRTTPLIRLAQGEAKLSDEVTIIENTRDGTEPPFDPAGFPRPAQVVLVEKGHYKDSLVSPRTAVEYGVAPNGAGGGEKPNSIEIAGGTIPRDDVLKELGTGLYIGNLWYLNYSDRNACRMTGMTRFATFWVENGKIERPVDVMRFDETIYRMLGDGLVGLTREREMVMSASTYGSRSTSSYRLPGVLVDGFTFTL